MHGACGPHIFRTWIMQKNTFATLCCLAPFMVSAAHGQSRDSTTAPAGVLTLDAQASSDVPQDVIHITLFYEQQASDPARLSETLNQHTAQALRDAHGGNQKDVTVQTGQLSIAPSNDKDGKLSGWRGRSELVLESHDFAAAARLAAQLNGEMQVADVSFSLSPEAQRDAQTKLTDQAIAAFRQQAQAAVQAFGYKSYTVREVNVARNGNFARPMKLMRGALASPAMDSIAVEAGRATVTVSVSGSVQMVP
jgi:predicted secreted protein